MLVKSMILISRLENSFKKFFARYQDHVEKYSVSCSEMIMDGLDSI